MEFVEVRPDEVRPGDYLCINDKLTRLVDVSEQWVKYGVGGRFGIIGKKDNLLGLKYKREVDDHPHGLIPDGYGSVIRVDGDIYVKRYSCWLRPLVDTYNHHEEMQQIVDRHGFEVLWPKPEVKITDEMVERGAHKLTKCAFFPDPERILEDSRRLAEKVLEAALGGDEK